MTLLQERFQGRFGRPARLYHAPGRVNLIGEHTDYNDGFVMPAAIGFYATVAAAPRDDRKIFIHSENLGESREIDLDALRPEKSWVDYVAGVAWALEQEGRRLRGADMMVRSDVPIGAGLSSSAALEVAAAWALLDGAVERGDIPRICRRAENEFVGMRCGIMDQFIACFGSAGHALRLDCRSLEFERLPVPAEVGIVICNTMVKHALSGSAYNERRADCEEGVAALSGVLPHVTALRDVTMRELTLHGGVLSPRVHDRCRHVVSENERVLLAADDLRRGDLAAFGARMSASHRSLRDDYEVSCKELDVMVELAWQVEGAYGARMTGGGFGGCTVNLVRKECVPRFQEWVGDGYKGATGIDPDIYVCTPADGAASL